MRKIIWRSLFWILWPLVSFYSPFRTRARIFVVCGDEFLVVKPYFGSGLWQLPGGGIKVGETPLKASVRELKEEAGLKVDPEKVNQLLAMRTYHENGLLKRYIVFTTEVTSKTGERIGDHEIVDLAWLPITGKIESCSTHVHYAVNAHKTK